MSQKTQDALAGRVKSALDETPTATVPELAEELEEDPITIETILDEYRVQENGKPYHVGPGGGGGWVSSPEE